MNEIIGCPNCQRQLQIPENFVGQLVQCPECRHQFKAMLATSEIQSAPPSPSVAPGRESNAPDEEPPRRRRRLDEDDDADDDIGLARRRPYQQPHRGTLVLILGILGICCIGAPITGILAWILGSSDLKEMTAGRMDLAGQSQTQTGKTLGMISVFLMIAGIAGYCLLIIGTGFFGGLHGPRRRR